MLHNKGPVMDWRPVQGVPRLSPNDRWDRLKSPRDPTDRISSYRKWMDGWMGFTINTKHEMKPLNNKKTIKDIQTLSN